MQTCNYKYTTLGELKIYGRTIRSSFSLPDVERNVMLFVLDRTVGWHNVWEFISPSEFVNGVRRRKSGNVRVVVAGTALTLEQLDEALASLKERGAIEIDRIGDKVVYKVNEDWSHPDLQGPPMWELNEADYDYFDGDTEDDDLPPLAE